VPSPRRHPGRLGCRVLAAAALISLGLTGLASTPAVRHSAGPLRHATLDASAGPLTAGQAQAQAVASGQPVTATALTTPASTTTANPDGSFSFSETDEPVRAWRNGAWENLDPTLHANPDGTISPAVTTTGLVLSGGGSSPLAVMSADARRLSLSWPGTLPAPTLSGATATYASVLPGVDLIITAGEQGGFSDVLVVHSATAAANPALASLKLGLAASGLTVTSDSSGDLTAAAGPSTPALFTAQAPRMWDSATPSATAASTTGSSGGTTAADGSGQPASSSAAGPGTAAHTADVPVTVSGKAITLTPPASALTGASTVYPVYIDPTWYPAGSAISAWTEVDSAWPTQSYWDESDNLQVGLCDFPGCNATFKARSFIRMAMPSLPTNAQVNAAYLYMTDHWAPSCTPAAAQLWTTGGISSSTTWNNQPSWQSEVQQKYFAYGYSSSCPWQAEDVTWDVGSVMQKDVANGASSQTFGVRAASESDDSQWKQFRHGTGNTTLTIKYNDPPGKPTGRGTNPGGACQYSASDGPVIGNNDVTLSATVGDPDTDALTTRFVVLNSDGSTAYDSAAQTPSQSVSTGSGKSAPAPLTLKRATIQGWHSDGTTKAYTYHWYAISTDGNGQSSPMPADDCYFTYNPLGPSTPSVSVPAAGTLGQQLTATFTPPAGCSPTTQPCPVTYTYQLGVSRPVTVTASGSTWTGPITLTQLGPAQLSVYGTASGGNPGPAATLTITGNQPATPYRDGYFTGGSYPDVLTTGTGAKPSLWLSPGTGNGSLGSPTDIGSLGTTINPGTDGPGDWLHTAVLHGNFTGDGVQDVMAYYPASGNAEIIAGNGNSSSLTPDIEHVFTIGAALMQSLANGDDPVRLTAAGNASQLATGTDDLIGITGDPANGYELDLYTNGLCTGCGAPGGYTWNTTLSTQAPDGTSDWNNYTLATTQPGSNPAATVLFALDTATGSLYQSTNPTQSATAVIGSGNWTQITVPWGTSPPVLASADINNAGTTELWTQTGNALTAYTLSGTTLSKETTGSNPATPTDDWPLTDGSPLAQTTTATAATDTITGSTAALTGGAAWASDDYFNADVTLDGKTGYLTPPPATLPASDTTPSVSVWFQTTTADGVLVSLQNQALSAGATYTGSYDPVLYIGTDGKLHAEWPNGTTTPIASTAIVDDGLWHHAVLTATSGSQSLYLDGQLQGTLTGTVTLTQTNPSNLTIGVGYTGGNWPAEPHYKQNGTTGYPDYFHGQIADITLTQ
jgi:Concanavalin A-like lectin/glucanases superfamily